VSAVQDARTALLGALEGIPGLTVTPHPPEVPNPPCAWLQDGFELLAPTGLGHVVVGLDVHVAVGVLDRDTAIRESDDLLDAIRLGLPYGVRWQAVSGRTYEAEAGLIRATIPTVTTWSP